MGKGLRKVTQSLALVAGLLRVKPKMIGVSQHVFEQQPRLIKHFGLGFREAKKKFTKPQEKEEFTMRRKKDEHYGYICQFFDTEKRRCTVYEARPSVCRSFPGSKRCGYYDFLMFERRAQEDDEFVATTKRERSTGT